MRLVETKSGNGVEWVLELTERERSRANARSLEYAGSFAANDPEWLEMTGVGRAKNDVQHDVVAPWMMAVADPKEKWWEWRRRDPKRSGEISQAAFLLKAKTLGFKVALPWGDSERYDFVVWMEEGGPIFRCR